MLGKDAWTVTYRLAFDLYFDFAEAALMSADFYLLEETAITLLEFANSNVDRAKIYVLKVAQYSLQGQFAESIQAGLQGLDHLGISVERDALPQLAQQEFAAVADSLQNRAIATLLDLPTATNPQVRAAIELLIILQPPAYIVSDFDLYSFATFRAVRLSIEHGNTAESIKAYATYGFLIGLMHTQYERGLEFADLALQLSYKLNSKFQRSGACFMLGCCIQVWAKPIQGAAEVNYEGFLAGMDSGEIPHAGYNLYSNICNRLFQGENLGDIATDIDKFWLIGEKLQHDFLLSILAACRFFVNQLSQSLQESEETGVTAEQVWVERYQASQSHTALGTYYILQMHRACLIPGSQRAIHYREQAAKSLNGCAGFTTSAGYYYYGSLILLNLYPSLEEAERSDIWQQIEVNQIQLKAWSESCSANFLHKYLLVEAERSRIAGKSLEAIKLYNQAIAEAQANGFIQEEALANELSAKFYLEWEQEKAAQGYMQEAYYCYARWGAKAKTDDLEKRYPQLLKPILEQRQTTFNPLETIATIAQTPSTSSTTYTNSTNISNILDFNSVLKAAQTISSSIELDELIASLTKILLENSGAKKSVLILPHKGNWQVRAITFISHQDNAIAQIETILDSQPVDTCQHIPKKIINYVKNTQETVAFDNGQTDIPGIIGEYMLAHQPCSVLCTPIINQGHLVAILYLENQLTSGVFTHERLQIINLLSSQAAISLENAQLYQQAQQALQDLQQAQLQIVQSEKMSALGNLVAGVAHEMNNPLGFISASLRQTKPTITDITEHLKLYQESLPNPDEEILEHAEEIDLDYSLEDLPKILDSMVMACDRLKNISTSLRTFSRADKDYKVAFNIHQGIDSTILILKHRLKANNKQPAIEVITEYGELPQVECFPGQLNQVFMNILANAIDALEESNTGHSFEQINENPNKITIKTVLENNSVKITIADNGKGMSQEVQQQIFEHLFTTKEVGKGTGLGLAIAKQIIEEKHGGKLSCNSAVGKGTEFAIAIPI